MTKKEKKDVSAVSEAVLEWQSVGWRDYEEIAKKAQLDYVNLKADFDFLVRQTKAKEQTLEQDTLIKVIKKLLPFVEDLRKSLMQLNDEQKLDGLWKGVQMVYDKFILALWELGVFPINEVGVEVNSQVHEPISTMPTDDENLKNKVIQIFTQGFIYKKDGVEILILPSKVIVGS